MSFEEDLYALLEVDAIASKTELTLKYKELEKKYHPTYQSFKLLSFQELRERQNIFKKIAEAYRILSNEKTRQEYDNYKKRKEPAKEPETFTKAETEPLPVQSVTDINEGTYNAIAPDMTKALNSETEPENISDNFIYDINERKKILYEDNYYHILGVEITSSLDLITEKYKKLEKTYNPSRQSFKLLPFQEVHENGIIYSKINRAYNTLKDLKTRLEYNQIISKAANTPSPAAMAAPEAKQAVLGSFPKNEDLYNILGLPPVATNEEITARYKELEAKHHPSKASFRLLSVQELRELNTYFSKIREAYKVLGNPRSRDLYDKTRNI